MARGKFLAEGVGTAKYFPNNPKGSFGDTVDPDCVTFEGLMSPNTWTFTTGKSENVRRDSLATYR